MEMPIVKEDFMFTLIATDDESYESGTYANIPLEIFIEGIYKHAMEEDMDYECTAFCFDLDAEDGEDILSTISLAVCGEDVFAELSINYSGICGSEDSEKYELDLSDVPMRKYGEVELYDFDLIVEKGVKLFNGVFREDEYIN